MYDRIANAISRLALWIATLAMTAMVLMTVADVVLRYLLNAPLSATTEFVQIFLAIIVFAGLVLVNQEGSQVVVSLFERPIDRYLPGLRRALYVISSAIATVFIAYVMIQVTINDFVYGELSMVMQYPLWMLAAAMAALAVLSVFQIWYVFRHGPSGHGSVE